MTAKITLELPDSVIKRAQATAETSGQPLETILTEWLEQGAAHQSEYNLEASHEYPIYTPLESYEAARILEQMLREHQASKDQADDK